MASVRGGEFGGIADNFKRLIEFNHCITIRVFFIRYHPYHSTSLYHPPLQAEAQRANDLEMKPYTTVTPLS